MRQATSNPIETAKWKAPSVTPVVKEKRDGEEGMTYVMGCKNPKALTIILRGSTSHVVAETKRAMEDAYGDILSVMENNKIVVGAGATEIEVYLRLQKFSKTFLGKQQLAIESFASALKVIPETLAQNAGLDKIEIIANLISKHNNNEINNGINVFTGKIFNALNAGVIEPLKIKTQAIISATEVAIMILRIDDIIISEPYKDRKL
jgi:chaperonin GroEL (HSP60 family)